ncbi:hypothetical protein [Yinghuangia seranimata]|uniref:hypothetical protein n=1 Tax=Yinghuangia seranimata TaxID=408067 RepID=UPI00248AA1B3|nr:hypothetical protein [Yinghuangia seranimata]MDI2128730.1 hypothetical protein [Yinghuangia seranimata]
MIPAREHGTSALAELDDDLAVAATAGQGLVAVSRALRLALRAVESWRADPARSGCLCRAAEEIRVALALVDGLTPARLRRAATWTGPVDDLLLYPVSAVARLLGRAARVLQSVARGGLPQDRPGLIGALLDDEGRAQCRTAWENTFHALIRLRAVQESATWFSDSAADPWLLLAAEAPPRARCEQCVPTSPRVPVGGAKIIPFPRRPPTSTG